MTDRLSERFGPVGINEYTVLNHFWNGGGSAGDNGFAGGFRHIAKPASRTGMLTAQ